MKRVLSLLALFIFVAVPASSSAHQGNPDYRSEITSIQPGALADGLTVEIVNFDDHVRLVNQTGKEVIINGYDGDPYARIESGGAVYVNLNSPAYYLNEDRFAAVEVPDRADPKAKPDWKQVADNGTFEWHDHRSHYMGTGTPSQVTDESKETKVFDYVIPIEVGGDARAATRRRREIPRFRQGADLFQSRIAADGTGLFAHELHAVVVGWIVAGRDHDAAVVSAVEGGEVHAFGAADADVVHLDATLVQPRAQGVGERRAGQADVAPHRDAAGVQELRHATSHRVGDLIVEFVGNPAAQVVGLEGRDRFQVFVPCRP